MKPPVDWSPCQQKGEEHEWIAGELVSRQGESPIWWCINCYIMLVDFTRGNDAGMGSLGESPRTA